MLEDPGQLARHPLDLLVGELEPREPRDVQDLLAIDHRAADSRPESGSAPRCEAPDRITRRDGERAERFVVFNLRLLAASFAVVGILFIVTPDGVLDVIADLGDWLRWELLTRRRRRRSSSGSRSASPTWW